MPANEMKHRPSELGVKIDPEYMLEATEEAQEPETIENREKVKFAVTERNELEPP